MPSTLSAPPSPPAAPPPLEASGSPLGRLGATDRVWDAVVVFVGLALLFSIGISAALLRQNLQAEYDRLNDAGLQLSFALDHELGVQAFAVEAMQAMAQDMLEGHTRLTYDPLPSLLPEPARGGYSLGLLPGYPAEQLGNLTGLGSLPAPGSELAGEIDMALSLSPIFASIKRRNPELPWIYYTSAQNFLYLYPRVSPDEFFFSPVVHEKFFFRGATPELNPRRRTFWSPVYLDQAGKGLMVTVSKPVYRGERFLGSISIDIGVQTLAWLLDSYEVPHSTVHLLNAEGQSMLDGSGQPGAPVDVAGLAPHVPTTVGEDEITLFPLQEVDWYVAIRTPQHALLLQALKQSVVYGLVVLFLLGSLILLLVLSRTLRHVRLLSLHDSLTGLYNRRHFDAVARQEFARIHRDHGSLGLVILDIDFFKKYNDHYGHQAGDRTLVAVAQALQGVLQRASDRLFRVGGEEFAVLAMLEPGQSLLPLLEKLGEAVRALNIPHQGSPLGRVTLSLGATVISSLDWVNVDIAYQRADKALYRAKESGRNRIELDSPL